MRKLLVAAVLTAAAAGTIGAVPASAAGANSAVTCHQGTTKTTCGRISNGKYTFCEWDGRLVTCGESPA